MNEEIKNIIELCKEGLIGPFHFYNLDLNTSQSIGLNYYINNPEDTIEVNQKLDIVFLDIEVYCQNSNEFPDPKEAKYPISAITLYSTKYKKIDAFFLILDVIRDKMKETSAEKIAEYIKNKLITDYSAEEDIKVEVRLFNNEFQMIKRCWEIIHLYDPAVLSGYASDEFDFPTIINRLSKFTKDVGKIISKFGKYEYEHSPERQSYLRIPDFWLLDLLYLYRPRDEGGRGFGRKQASYSLNYLSEILLGVKKVEYNTTGMSLDKFYEVDPVNYLLYNVVDVFLTKKLNEKNKHIELINMLRRFMKTTASNGSRGSTVLFDTYVLYKLREKNSFIRYLTKVSNFSIHESEIKKIPLPKDGRIKNWTPRALDQRTVYNIINRFPGAYVKDPPIKKIYTLSDGIIGDLDASSLYPSMMLQNNISFDSFYGRVIDPITYKTIALLEDKLGSENNYDRNFFNLIFEKIVFPYVNKLEPQNKTQYQVDLYTIVVYLFLKLKEKNIPLQRLFSPSNLEEYFVLKRYFLNLIELLEEIHPDANEYNSFAYEYLFGSIENIPNELYIILDINEPMIQIKKINISDFENFLKENKLILTLTGCLFYKHEKRKGIFTDFLLELRDLRKTYKKKRDSFPKNSEEYQFYDMRQNIIKIVMNSTYGLMGQPTFRFSNKWIAKSITTHGRLTLKLAQYIGDRTLQSIS